VLATTSHPPYDGSCDSREQKTYQSDVRWCLQLVEDLEQREITIQVIEKATVEAAVVAQMLAMLALDPSMVFARLP